MEGSDPAIWSGHDFLAFFLPGDGGEGKASCEADQQSREGDIDFSEA